MWAVKTCKMQGLIPFLWLHPLLIRLRVVYRQPQGHTQAIDNFLRLSFNICFRLKGKKNRVMNNFAGVQESEILCSRSLQMKKQEART